MSYSSYEQFLQTYPDLYGFVITEETREYISIKGIRFEIKRYKTKLLTRGIRVSLIDNTSELFVKFNEFLASCAERRTAEEKALNMWSFTTLTLNDPELDQLPWSGSGFYVYNNHIIFNEERKSKAPEERLLLFIDFYKRKFNITTSLREDEFKVLDKLELT